MALSPRVRLGVLSCQCTLQVHDNIPYGIPQPTTWDSYALQIRPRLSLKRAHGILDRDLLPHVAQHARLQKLKIRTSRARTE
jgi:hypothetical protein